MKKFIFSLVILGLSTVIMSAAVKSPAQKLDALVDEVELKCESYTQEDWEKVGEKYEELFDQFNDKLDSMTDSERQMGFRAIGRYHAVLVKRGIKSASSYIKDFSETIPAYIEGFTSAIKENGETLGSLLDGIIEELKSL